MSDTTIYDMGFDLVIVDAEVEQMSTMFAQKLELYEIHLKKLIEIMEQVSEDAIMEGKLAKNLKELNVQLHSLMNETYPIKTRISKLLADYLVEIENADGELYGAFGFGIDNNFGQDRNDQIRDYTRETLSELEQQVEEIQSGIGAQGDMWYLWQTEFPEVDFEGYPQSMLQTQNQLSEELFQLPYRWNDELCKVHQVEETYAAKLSEIKELLELYEQRIHCVAEMFQPEKMTMEPSEYQLQFTRIHEPYYDRKAKLQLLEQYLTKEQLENLLALGYTNQELLELYKSFNGQDAAFFCHLAGGTLESYQEAFTVNPKLLSDLMNAVMADYAMRLLMTDPTDCTQLEAFNNAMLSATYYFQTVEIGYTDDTLCYSDYYLLKISSGAEKILSDSTVGLAMMNPEAEAYQSLSEQHFVKLAMMNYWMSETVVLNEIMREEGIINMHSAQIGELTYSENGSFTFNVHHARGIPQAHLDSGKQERHEWEGIPYEELETVESVITTLYLTPDILSQTIDAENIRDARKVYESYVEMAVSEIAFGAVVDTTSDFIEAAFSGVGFVGGIATGLGYAIDIAQAMEGYEEVKRRLSEEENEAMAKQFSIGGGCIINTEERICFEGVYDPEIYREMRQIEQDGLGVVRGWDQIEVGEEGNTVLEIIKEQIEGQRELKGAVFGLLELEEVLLTGGFSFDDMTYTNKNGEVVEVDVKDFILAWRNLNEGDYRQYE